MTDEYVDLKSAIVDIIKEEFEIAPMVGSFAVLCELHQEDGPFLFCLQSDDMPLWIELGMIESRAAEIRKQWAAS